MWKWIILVAAAYILYRLFANDIKRKFAKQNDTTEMERKVAEGEMVKDPHCGAYVDIDSSISVRDGETLHRFCSYDCRDAYLKTLENGGRVLPEQEKKEG